MTFWPAASSSTTDDAIPWPCPGDPLPVQSGSFARRGNTHPAGEGPVMRMILSISGLSLLLAAAPAFVAAQVPIFQTPLSPRIADYTIAVTLDTKTHVLHGREMLRWINRSAVTVGELRLHLYLNAFRNVHSTFLTESSDRLRKRVASDNGWGYIDVTSITTGRGEDLTARAEFIHPDDQNASDRTVMRLPLPGSVAPGDSVVLNFTFVEKVPEPPIARAGEKAEYYLVGQWFPKVGVLVDGEWNCHQYHANSEFFADFGVYDVAITVPKACIVGATGIEIGTSGNGDSTVTHRYHAEDVHDFAWTASPEYVEFTGHAENVAIRILMQPDHLDQAKRYIDAAETAITYFHDWYGEYPYPNLTVVDPRRGALNTGGMEYPTFITAGTFHGLPAGIRLDELAIIHEFGHNYWYHMLASNEFEESWMDEGINTYTEIRIMNARYGPAGDGIDLAGCRLNDLQFQRLQYLTLPDADPTLRKAWEYYSGASYGVNSYAKPGLLLTTLENYVGKDVMFNIMREYVRRWKFKHPTTKDFIDVACDVSGKDLHHFFDQAIYSNATLDYSVDLVSTTETDTASYNAVSQFARAPAGDSASRKAGPLYLSVVKIRRLGEFRFPVEIQSAFENGDTVRERWDGEELWKTFRYVRASRLVSSTVDPDHKVCLDIDYTNNSKTVEQHQTGIDKTVARFMFWIQSMLDAPESIHVLISIPSLF